MGGFTTIPFLQRRIRELLVALETARSQERGAKSMMLELAGEVAALNRRLAAEKPEEYILLKEAEQLRARNRRLAEENDHLQVLAGFARNTDVAR